MSRKSHQQTTGYAQVTNILPFACEAMSAHMSELTFFALASPSLKKENLTFSCSNLCTRWILNSCTVSVDPQTTIYNIRFSIHSTIDTLYLSSLFLKLSFLVNSNVQCVRVNQDWLPGQGSRIIRSVILEAFLTITFSTHPERSDPYTCLITLLCSSEPNSFEVF